MPLTVNLQKDKAAAALWIEAEVTFAWFIERKPDQIGRSQGTKTLATRTVVRQ